MNGTTLRGEAPGGGVVPALVERGRELAVIARALDAASAGSGAVLLIEGEAGIGKTRLLHEGRDAVESRGMVRLQADASELERPFAFGVIRQLLEPELQDPEAAARILTGAAAVVAPLLGGSPPDASLPPQDLDSALLHGIYWALVHLSEQRPAALLVDDLQWADRPSVRALEYVASRVAEHPLALILASRGRPVSEPGGFAKLATESRIRPSALTEAGSSRVLEDLLGPSSDDFSSAAHRVTGGNPFLLREIALATATADIPLDRRSAERIGELGPASVANWTLARLARLPERSRRIAASLAILERAELQVVAAHADLDPAIAAEAADELAEVGLVERELPLRFSHPIVRSALYGQLAPAARERGHLLAAKALHDRGVAPERVASTCCRPNRARRSGRRPSCARLLVPPGHVAARRRRSTSCVVRSRRGRTGEIRRCCWSWGWRSWRRAGRTRSSIWRRHPRRMHRRSCRAPSMARWRRAGTWRATPSGPSKRSARRSTRCRRGPGARSRRSSSSATE